VRGKRDGVLTLATRNTDELFDLRFTIYKSCKFIKTWESQVMPLQLIEVNWSVRPVIINTMITKCNF